MDKKFCKKKGIKIKSILDIGGNCGLTSMLSRQFFPDSTIHCYEPNIDIEKFLKPNSEIANFKYFLEAVGANTKMVKLNIDTNQSYQVFHLINSVQLDKYHLKKC